MFLLMFKQHNTPLSLPPLKTRQQISRRVTAAAFIESQRSWEKRGRRKSQSLPLPPHREQRARREGSGAARSPPNLEMPDKAAAWQRIRTIKSFN